MAVILTGVRYISLWFWFPFPWWLVILSIFSCICWPSVCLSWKSVYSGPLTIFYFILLVYIFILAELSLCFGAWAFSSCTSQGLLWLQCAAFSCYRAWALECTGSAVAMHGLSCPVACGILVPQPGIEPISPIGRWILNQWTIRVLWGPRSSDYFFFNNWVVWIFWYCVVWVLCMLWILTPYQIYCLLISYPIY